MIQSGLRVWLTRSNHMQIPAASPLIPVIRGRADVTPLSRFSAYPLASLTGFPRDTMHAALLAIACVFSLSRSPSASPRRTVTLNLHSWEGGGEGGLGQPSPCNTTTAAHTFFPTAYGSGGLRDLLDSGPTSVQLRLSGRSRAVTFVSLLCERTFGSRHLRSQKKVRDAHRSLLKSEWCVAFLQAAAEWWSMIHSQTYSWKAA